MFQVHETIAETCPASARIISSFEEEIVRFRIAESVAKAEMVVHIRK